MKKTSQYFIFIVIAAAILIWAAGFSKPSDKLKVTFCDVGQGDAAFIQFPDQQELLIDGGPNNSVLNCIGKNMAFYDRKISFIAISHPDADHITGLIEVFKRYEVDTVLLTGATSDNIIYQKILDLIKEKNIKIHYVNTGQTFDFGGISVKIIYPYISYQNQSSSNANETSMVIRIEDGKVNYLFTGDIDKKTADKIVQNSSSVIKSQILKVPHHGSKDFSEDFIKAVNPEISIISVGTKNRYGHPSKELIDFLDKYEFKYLRTDKFGDIRIESDGNEYSMM